MAFSKNILFTPLIATLVFISGLLGQLLAVPPGYASPLWPPAGIAVVALLIRGRVVLPGIFLGSLGLNIWIGLNIVGIRGTEIYYSAIGIALGSSLQALFAVWLAKKYVGPDPTNLTSLKSIITFLALIGPAASVIAATVGVSCLKASGIMPSAAAANSWLHWWVGDSLGAITVCPLLLCFLANPKELWRPRRFSYALPMTVVLGGLMATFSSVYHQEQRQLQLTFNTKALPIEKQIQDKIAGIDNAVLATAAFFKSSGNIERDKFTTFATSLLRQDTQIQALSWAPLVSHDQVRNFERNAHRNGLPGFSITERGASEALVPVHSGKVHFPVFYIAPLSGNETALGYDLFSESRRRNALERASSTGEFTITERLQLVQDAANNSSILAAAPVYDTTPKSKTLAGYVTAVVRIKPLVENAIAGLETRHLSILLQDQGASDGAINLYSNTERELSQNSNIQAQNSIIAIGGRTWTLSVSPDTDYVSAHGSWLPWLTLTGGLILTSLLSILILSVTGHSAQVEQEVRTRTQELRDSERRLRAIIDAAPVPFAINDDQQNIVYLNHAFRKLFGYSLDDIPTLAQWWPRAYPDVTYRAWVTDEWRRRLEYSRSQRLSFEPMELNVRAKDGQAKTVIVGAAPLGENDAEMHLVYLFDITERKRAESLLKAHQEKLHQILESSPIAVRIATSDGRKVLFANQSYAKLINSDPEKLIGIDPKPYYASPLEYEEIVRAINRGQSVYEKEIELYIPGKGTAWALASYMPIEYEGKLSVLGWFYDVTTLYEAKTLAENLAKMKSEFLANMSHEIRTPMNGVIGLTQLALNEDISPKVRDYLEKINSSSESLLEILNDILDVSKLEAGKFTIDHQRFDLGLVLTNIHNLFQHRAEGKHLDLHIDITEDTPTDLIGDALRLQQILANLIGNAIKFTERGEISLKIHTVDKIGSHARIQFQVSDTGIGISEADLQKLFQPFSQVDTSASRRFGGTGLGLAISRNLLQLMGTELKVESIPGKGSTFSFDLPVSLASEQLYSAIEQNIAVHQEGLLGAELRERGKVISGARILIAEDNIINQQVVREFLKLSNVQVDIANNGVEVLEFIVKNDYDAVLMDVHMPEMDGVEATQRIRANSKYANLPVIALTAGVTKEEQENCLKAGMNDFLPKPVNPEQMIEILAKWVKPKKSSSTPSAPTQSQDRWGEIEAQLPGFDLSNLRAMIGGSAELLQQLLKSFYDSYAGISDEINDLIQKNAFKEAEETLHKLKGAAGGIGAMTLHVACESLDSELKQGSYKEETLQMWLDAYAKNLLTLENLLKS